MNHHMTRPEHREALGWGLMLALVSSMPYLLGYLGSPAEKYFLGFVLNAVDQNTYFMWMSQVASGEVLLRNLYTSIPHDGAMLNLVFLAAGWAGRLLGSLDLAYQLLRVTAVVLLAWSAWLFVATFVASREHRRWLFLAVVFGAGVGWIWNLYRLVNGDFGGLVFDTELLSRPLDLWVPEGFIFYSMLVMPHFTMAIALLLLTVRYAAIGVAENRLAPTVAAGVLCFALSFVHPYDVLIALGLAWGVAGLHSLRHRRLDPAVWRHVGVLLLIGSGPVLYNYWILNSNPGMQAWLVQNHSASPAPASYLAGYGLLLAGAAFYTVKHRRDWGADLSPRQWLFAWLLILPLALYAPIDFQRRLVIGASAPMAILAMLLLLDWLRAQRFNLRHARTAALALVIGLVSLSSTFHWLNSFRKAHDHDGEMFVERRMVETLQAIAAAPPGNGTVLARFETGNHVPRFTGRATVIGSRGQTGNFDRLLDSTEAFYRGEMTDERMSAFLEEQRVGWVVIGPHEAAIMPPDLRSRLTRLDLQSWHRDGPYEALMRAPVDQTRQATGLTTAIMPRKVRCVSTLRSVLPLSANKTLQVSCRRPSGTATRKAYRRPPGPVPAESPG